jgi:N utilization substance protein B
MMATSTRKPDLSRLRSLARRRVLQALYQWQLAGQDLKQIETQFNEEMDMRQVDLEYFRELLFGIPTKLDELDALLQPAIDRAFATIDPVEKAILRMGAYELNERLDIPLRVVINEAVELAKQFGAEQSHKYINGVLDKVARANSFRAAEIKAPAR